MPRRLARQLLKRQTPSSEAVQGAGAELMVLEPTGSTARRKQGVDGPLRSVSVHHRSAQMQDIRSGSSSYRGIGSNTWTAELQTHADGHWCIRFPYRAGGTYCWSHWGRRDKAAAGRLTVDGIGIWPCYG